MVFLPIDPRGVPNPGGRRRVFLFGMPELHCDIRARVSDTALCLPERDHLLLLADYWPNTAAVRLQPRLCPCISADLLLQHVEAYSAGLAGLRLFLLHVFVLVGGIPPVLRGKSKSLQEMQEVFGVYCQVEFQVGRTGTLGRGGAE